LTLAVTLLLMSIGDFLFIKKDIREQFKQGNPTSIIVQEDSLNTITDGIEKQIAFDDLLMIFIIFPISGFITFLLVERALNTFKRVTKAVANREPRYLESVELEGVPQEIQPLVKAINQLLIRLKEGFEREKRFAADAAHELRTPLAALKTQAQVALRAEDPEVKKLALQHVIEGVDRSTHLVQQLLTFSRLIAQGDAMVEMTSVPVYKLMSEIIANMVPGAIAKGLEIELLPGNEKLMMQGNAKALNILIFNLLDNAIRYTPAGGTITTSVEKDEHSIILKVSDNGNGIPEELHGRLFERFFRVLGNDTPGSGLGFAIVEQIVKLHKAEIKISAPISGKGLEVSIFFPVILEYKI
jgi:two-component system, OmpR family, sensor histidine kinase QseC